ncbi:MFS transporter SP family sugar:H+ symporter [Microdochium nivale]|nr:MFS transporter SP family sugar:H+ symporter [Microdochium nivale]
MGKSNWYSTHAQGTSDPAEVRNGHIHLVALVASMSALAMGYDTSVIGGTMALDSFVRDFKMGELAPYTRDTIQANIVSTFQAGCAAGALFTFPLAERIGRRWTIVFGALVFLLGGTLMTAAMGNLNMIYAGRAIAGLGIGCTSLVVPVYISETAPPSIRGRLIGIFEVASQGGGMMGFWINYATNRTIPVEQQAQWIIPLAIQLIPGVLLVAGMILFCPESPRYRARMDDFEGCERILVKLRNLPADHPYMVNEINEIREQIQMRSTLTMSKKEQFMKLFQKGTRNRMGIAMALMFLQSFTGTNVITYYAPRIFQSIGISGTSNKLFSTGFYGISKTLGMIAFTVIVVERVGRRKGLVWGSALGMVPMFFLGGYVLIADPTSKVSTGAIQQDGWGYAAMAAIYLNAFIICATWQGITWTYASEIFPLDIRMLCVAITTCTTWIGSFTIARITPHMITSLGYGTYFFFGAVLVLMGIWALFFVPETKGVSLEDMDGLFSVPTSKICWAQMRGKPTPLPAGSGNDADSITAEKGQAKHLD